MKLNNSIVTVPAASAASFGSIEPELRTPPPRRVRAKRNLGCGLWGLRLFLLPHTLVGIGSLGCTVIIALVLALGTSVPGSIVSHENNSDSDGDSYRLHYTYRVGSTWYHNKQKVPYNVFVRLADNAPVEVKTLPFAPQRFSIVIVEGVLWSQLGFLLLWSLFWNAILSVFLWLFWVAPLQNKRLISHGAIARGVITRKEIVTGSYSDTHYLHYRWQPPQGAPRDEKMAVQSDEYLQAQPDDEVTVLYKAKRPQHNTLYRYAAYQVV